jgi:aminopeptidase N
MSSNGPRSLFTGLSRHFLLFLPVLLFLGIPLTALAQEQMPREFRRDEARMKAELFERIHRANVSQTANQTDYDVTYYDIDLDIDPVSETVTGTVTVTATVTALTLSTVDLDLLGNMTVTGVTDTGGSLAFSHVGDILTVTLSATYTTGQSFTIYVAYNGTPSASYGSFGFDTVGSQPMIWSLSEPYGARSWWPCKDIPEDKADSVDIHITVPDNLIVASNGTLVSEVDNGSTKTYNWHEGYPITTYLVSVAIHPYTQFSHWYHYAPAESMEVAYYVFPANYSAVQATYALTVPMIEVFADLFGEYPFIEEKYGHAEFVWGGGMEHQTITSLGGWSEYLIAHELAHMWWGDMITCDSFHHIWLNEGFATYSEALWSEQVYGVEQYHQDMAYAKYFGAGTIYVPDPNDFSRIFHSGLSYNKGSWVPHMLRHIVGDTTFFNILQTYYADVRFFY